MTLKTFGRIDVLINNAGLGKTNLFIEQPEEEITNFTQVIFSRLLDIYEYKELHEWLKPLKNLIMIFLQIL